MRLNVKAQKFVFLFSLFLLGLQTVNAANLGYWGGLVNLDGTQVNASYTISVLADGTKVREDTLGTGPETPAEYYLLVVEESEGTGKAITFRLKPAAQADTCVLDAAEGTQAWVIGPHTLNLNFTKLADTSSCACNDVCQSGSCVTSHCCPAGYKWSGSKCYVSSGGGGGSSGGSSNSHSCIPTWDCTSWSTCSLTGVQTRTCTDLKNCSTVSANYIPVLTQNCEYQGAGDGGSGITDVDTDGDGVPDKEDAFPNDPTETKDSDSDGVGDNKDAFPRDPTETKDSDNDGVGDNKDAFPNDPTETADSDNDGVGDNKDADPYNPKIKNAQDKENEEANNKKTNPITGAVIGTTDTPSIWWGILIVLFLVAIGGFIGYTIMKKRKK